MTLFYYISDMPVGSLTIETTTKTAITLDTPVMYSDIFYNGFYNIYTPSEQFRFSSNF